MIVPWLRGILDWNQAPLTYTLIFLNAFFFVLFLDTAHQKVSHSNLMKSENLILLGKVYHEFYHKNESLPDEEALLLMGAKSLKNEVFLDSLTEKSFSVDEVQFQKLLASIQSFQGGMKERQLFKFGISHFNTSPTLLITYQFMHSHLFHLLGNMLLLLIVGASLELAIGSFVFLLIFLLSGVGGGLFYLLWSEPSLAPMVGASGAISGLISFYALWEKKKNVSFFYFVSPFPGHYGWIYLPVLCLLPLSFASDLASYLSTPVEFSSSIAYLAHFGGALTGLTLWGFYRMISFGQKKSSTIPSNS